MLFIRNFHGHEIQVWQNADGWRFEVVKLNRTRQSIEGTRYSKAAAITQAKEYAEKGW